MRELADCQKCLLNNPACNFVMGEGSITPGRVMFVGEAPGQEENDQKRPFVGAAGNLFNKLLWMADINRDEVYVTNLCKCRPPNNRTPTAEEMICCWPVLEREILITQPRMIVALGSAAAVFLTGKGDKILSACGDIFPCIRPGFENYSVMLTAHPSYFNRNYTFVGIVLQSNYYRKALNPPQKYPENYRLQLPINELKEALDDYKKRGVCIEVDIETVGEADDDALDPWKAEITGIAFSPKPGEAVNTSFSGRQDPKWVVIKEFLEDIEVPKALHNGVFDDCVLRVSQGILTSNLVYDTRGGASIEFSDMKQNLDLLRSLHTTETAYKEGLRSYAKSTRQLNLGIYGEQTHWANCKDVDVQYQVMNSQLESFNPKQKDLMKRLVAYDRLAVDMRVRGVSVSKDSLALHMVDLQPQVEALENWFWDKYNVNPNSPKQVAELFFERLNFPIVRGAKTQTGWSVDEEVVEELKKKVMVEEDKEVLNKLIEVRGLSRGMSTYVVGVYKQIGGDGKLHPQWIPTGTDTGRWACREPNLQNQPLIYRDNYVPSPGKIFFISDFKGLELLWLFLRAGDYESAERFVDPSAKWDPHHEMMLKMNEVYPCERTTTKSFVFGTAYGLKASTAARTFGVPLHIAQAWQEMAVGRFPKLLETREKLVSDWKRTGYVESVRGRRKFAETENQALNSPYQGDAGDTCGDALLALKDAEWHPIIQVHDEVICEEDESWNTPEKHKEYINIVEGASKEIFYRFPVSSKISYRWEK